MPFQKLIFRNGQQVRDADYIISGAMTSDEYQRSLLLSSFCVNNWAVNKITALGTSPIITYELWNVNSVRWSCLNIATDRREDDNWKSEVISLVVEIWFWYSLLSIQGEAKGMQHTFVCQSYPLLPAYFDIWYAENHWTKKRSVPERHLYSGSWN